MAKVNKESGNTDTMMHHQLKKLGQQKDNTKIIEVELGAEELSGKRMFDFRQTICLNSDQKYIKNENINKLFIPQDESTKLVSDADAQLLIKIFFQEKVNLTQLHFRVDEKPEDVDGEETSCEPPAKIRIFTNQPDLDFSDIEDYKAVLQHDFTSEITGSKEKNEGTCRDVLKLQLAGPKFQRCSSLQIFVEEAFEEAELSFLNYLGVHGILAPDYHTSYN
ncbi:unnamed protein product [Amoebophrya sp. A120]|nr:unnamed protein product [Amoebophrya sp. A120]|eukprot:GSA120T00007216001.1